MPVLTDLSDAPLKEMPCVFIEVAHNLPHVLRKDMAVTAADVNGAINIWYDKDRLIRCERQRYMRRMDEKKYKTMIGAIKWLERALELIK